MDSATVARLIAEDPLWEDALRIHYDALIMDGHIDTPTEMLLRRYRFASRHRARGGSAHVDLPRMIEGGLDAPFFAIWVSRDLGEGENATRRATDMVAEIERQITAASGVEIARTAADVRRVTARGDKVVLLGLEGGHALAGSVDVLRDLAAAGVRYVTLTHTNSNKLADSSQDRPIHDGLSELGEEMVREMNRMGVLVDVSHVSDATLDDVLRVSTAPVIASHSSARALVDNPRNLSDDQMRAIAASGGVVMINYYNPVVNRRLTPEVMEAARQRLERTYGGDGAKLWTAVREEQQARKIPEPTLDDVVAHIEHAVQVIGADHVGLGSDFDGVPRLPDGLGDVTRLPWVTYGLLRGGMSETDVRKVLGLSTLRVLEDAERVANTP
ncbi:hypothetical protein BSZ36_14330 [Rubricoccus marinus]|uniref:Membrane dipeptidase n=2 Tax=Rubricoccus marinus TaxID=716817 RepID=A0A259U406_9BACT|nr:hypothetical protein BSZ36_14330 [Rubricoccus marinus]